MRFEEAYSGWGERRLTQAQAAQLLGVCTRTFRRTIHRYEDEGLDGLLDRRMSRISHRPPISACPRESGGRDLDQPWASAYCRIVSSFGRSVILSGFRYI